jgi:PAS domain S-box-containing protein
MSNAFEPGSLNANGADPDPNPPVRPMVPSEIEARFWLAAIAESSDDAIIGKNLNGIVTSWNKAAESMFGFTAQELVGHPITAIIPPDRIDEEASILERVRRAEKIVHFETKRLCKDGRTIPVSLSVSPIRDAHGKIIGASKIAHDLTRRDAREQQLRAANAELERLARHLAKERDRARHANQAKSRFLASVSHELRTPLNGILGYAELLHMEGGLSATQATRVDAMLAAGKHLLQMITCVLDLSEIEAERVEVRLAECDIKAIATACLDLVRPEAEAKKLAITLAVSPGTRCTLVTDPMRLRQVLFNLLGNAVKFTSRGAVELRLRTMADCAALRVEVTDTGPGIPADQRQRLFKEFERLDNTPINGIEGAGLGLALSARLAALMGAQMGHEDNPNGGSVFWLELPLNAVPTATVSATAAPVAAPPIAAPTPLPPVAAHTPPPIAAAAPPPVTPPVAASVPLAAAAAHHKEVAEPGTAASHPMNVLVVDDVMMNRDIAASFLSAAGHAVTCAEDGEDAVAAVENTMFDVVLMDVRMPRMDGLEATRRIRALGGDRGRVPIVAMTAHAFTEQVEECRKAGMDGHLAKPFDQAALLAAATRAAEAGRAHTGVLAALSAAAVKTVPMIGSELQVVDAKAFDNTTAYLAPDSVAAYLDSMMRDAKELLVGLNDVEAMLRDGDQVAHAVHTLAGSAGLFGFERLAALGRRFDKAIRSGGDEAPALAEALIGTIEATVQAIRERTARFSAGVPPVLNSRSQQVRILIVEDDELQAQVLKSFLTTSGFAVDAVTSGLDAVRKMQPGLFDVVLVDYSIPEINGLAVARLIEDLMGQLVRPILIALTATPEDLTARESGTTSAFDAIIGKSSDFSGLLTSIRALLEAAPDAASLEAAGSALVLKEWEDYDAEPERPGASGDDPGLPRILLAEDDELQRQLLTDVLEHRGYVVESACNGLEALRKIREGCFDLVLVDYNLPEMDGLATGALVIELMQEHIRPRLIALTATPTQLQEKEREPGSVFDEVLGKSADLDALLVTIDRHLRSSPNPQTRRAAAHTQPIGRAA